MKRAFMWGLSASVLVLAVQLSAQRAALPTSKTPPPATDEAAIRNLEQRWEQALLRNDQTTIDQIVSPDCLFVSSTGELMNKAQADADRQNTVLRSSTTTQMVVRIVTPTVAVVIGSNVETSQYAGQDTSGQYRWTDVFQKTNGQWRVVSAQSTLIDESPKASAPPETPVGSSLDGLSADQVRERLGKPSIEMTDAKGVTTWYFTTPQGVTKVYIYQGKASTNPPR